MSEVDRLNNSGVYPILPISDRQRGNDGGNSSQEPRPPTPRPEDAKRLDPNSPRPPKSLIDEYA